MRKKISTLLLTMVLVVPSIIPVFAAEVSSDEYQEIQISVSDDSIDPEKIIDVLDAYAFQREREFYVDESFGIKLVGENEERTEREQHIEEWKDELEINIVDAETQYNVKEVLLDTSESQKLLVYEWVWIDYICDGYDEIERMGFGTDHILEFSKNNDELQLVNDSYSEVTGYEVGVFEDLVALKERVRNDILVDYPVDILNEEITPMVSDTYNASAAVSYSNEWCGNSNAGTWVEMNPVNYNPEYYYIPGLDCCNFVSQCLEAGGMTMSGIWTATKNTSGDVVADPSLSQSGQAWRYVPTFVEYWTGKGHLATRITNSDQAVIGNPIYWLKDDGYENNHIMLIVGKNAAGKVLINGHNYDAYRYPLTLSSKIYYTLELKHSYTTAYANNASTHTLRCSICSGTKVEAHVFASTASLEQNHSENEINATLRCTICGYTK